MGNADLSDSAPIDATAPPRECPDGDADQLHDIIAVYLLIDHRHTSNDDCIARSRRQLASNSRNNVVRNSVVGEVESGMYSSGSNTGHSGRVEVGHGNLEICVQSEKLILD